MTRSPLRLRPAWVQPRRTVRGRRLLSVLRTSRKFVLSFLRQAAGETAHDIQVIDAVLARTPPGQPDPVNFVARAYCFWGREAVMNHFRTIFTGTWRFE